MTLGNLIPVWFIYNWITGSGKKEEDSVISMHLPVLGILLHSRRRLYSSSFPQFQAFDSEWDKNTKGMNPTWRGIVVIIIILAIWLVIR